MLPEYFHSIISVSLNQHFDGFYQNSGYFKVDFSSASKLTLSNLTQSIALNPNQQNVKALYDLKVDVIRDEFISANGFVAPRFNSSAAIDIMREFYNTVIEFCEILKITDYLRNVPSNLEEKVKELIKKAFKSEASARRLIERISGEEWR